MKTDKTTKLLLALIAVGLWLNAAAQLFRPATVGAQNMSGVEGKLTNIEGHLYGIAIGGCANKKIC